MILQLINSNLLSRLKTGISAILLPFAEERLAMFELMDKAKLGLDSEFHPAGYNLGLNDGAAAGQTVMHVHFHLIPRYTGDNGDARGGVRWVLPAKAKYWK